MSQSALEFVPPADAPNSPKRQAIVEAASRLFLNQGFGAVSVDAIAAEAKVSKRTVYSHFENKQGLFAGVMTGVCEKQGGKDGCPLSNEDAAQYVPISEMLRKTGEYVLGIITAPETIEVFRVVMGDAGRFPELGRNFYEFGPGSILEMMTDYFSLKSESGELTLDDPAQAARYFLGMMTFPIHMQLACGVRKSPSEKEIQKIVADAVDAVMKLYST